MNWFDEGALYSQIGAFLREDMGRGDITTQSIITRNTRARARFVAGEKMVVAGLEAVEEVFLTLDSQLQLEAFAADGEEVEAGKVIARTVGFADVLLTGEQVALNVLQHLSGIATLTRKYVDAIAGTKAQIVDARTTTPGLRQLEKYAVATGGGLNSRFGLDDGVVITENHSFIVGSVTAAVKQAKEKLGYLHKIAVQISVESELHQALAAGADVIMLDVSNAGDAAQLVKIAKDFSNSVIVECSGVIVLENVREFAEAGADLIRIDELTNSAPAALISFDLQLY
ncbi:MAG TPA: carboxylating nicotinate-nucleotide diphosphorylase [Pyrinomonadaceae bacterium]